MEGACARRRFLAVLPVAAIGSLGAVRSVGAVGTHPEPRPGIDARNILTAEQLVDVPELIELYDAVREIPHILDGIRCYCGCADLPGYRSLLICYEQGGMAKHCEICQGAGRLAHDRCKEGQSLDQIRRAIDARFS